MYDDLKDKNVFMMICHNPIQIKFKYYQSLSHHRLEVEENPW